jgi:DNA-binding transcriptional regulator YdaS (Cro superfamily)
MDLKTYLQKTKTTTVVLANKVGVAQAYISHLASRKRRPSPDLALRIQEATRGEVTILELLYPDPPKRP